MGANRPYRYSIILFRSGGSRVIVIDVRGKCEKCDFDKSVTSVIETTPESRSKEIKRAVNRSTDLFKVHEHPVVITWEVVDA